MTTERFNQRPCPPEVRGFISHMEGLMCEPQYNHAAIPTQVAIDLQRAGYVTSFAHFETCLREIGSRVHFLAVPIDFFGDQYTTAYPLGREDQPQYTLYAAVNGADEAAQMLERLGITAEENVARLENAGVLNLSQNQ